MTITLQILSSNMGKIKEFNDSHRIVDAMCLPVGSTNVELIWKWYVLVISLPAKIQLLFRKIKVFI